MLYVSVMDVTLINEGMPQLKSNLIVVLLLLPKFHM